MPDFGFSVDLRVLEGLAAISPDIVEREVQAVLEIVAARVEKTVVERTPRGVGGEAGLAGSIHGEVVSYGQGMQAVISTPLEYGEVVELGRRPDKKRPPVAPIALWAIRKLGVSAEEAQGIGFVIARKIGKVGFEGAHMFEKTMQELDGWIMEQLNSIPQRVNERITGALR